MFMLFLHLGSGINSQACCYKKNSELTVAEYNLGQSCGSKTRALLHVVNITQILYFCLLTSSFASEKGQHEKQVREKSHHQNIIF